MEAIRVGYVFGVSGKIMQAVLLGKFAYLRIDKKTAKGKEKSKEENV